MKKQSHNYTFVSFLSRHRLLPKNMVYLTSTGSASTYSFFLHSLFIMILTLHTLKSLQFSIAQTVVLSQEPKFLYTFFPKRRLPCYGISHNGILHNNTQRFSSREYFDLCPHTVLGNVKHKYRYRVMLTKVLKIVQKIGRTYNRLLCTWKEWHSTF